MELTIRRANTTDIPTLAKLLTDATSYKVAHGDMAWDTTAWSNEEVAADMQANPMYTVLSQGEIVGVCILQWEDAMWGTPPPDAGYLHRLAVRQGLHGQNLGAHIMDWAADQVRAKGRQYLRLDCPADNTELCAYYQAHGFSHVATKSNPMIAGYTAAYFERKVI